MFIISSCSYFDEPEKILPGKRENVFQFDDDIIVKSNQKIIIDESIPVSKWSQQYQNERNHLFHFKSNSSLKLKKKIRLKNLAFDRIDHVTIPVFSEKNIFYADNEYNIYSLDFETNRINWRQRLEKEKKEGLPFIGGFSLSDEFLFITTGLGFVHAINTRNGNIIWSKNFLAQFSRPPLSVGNFIYAVSDDNQTFALDRKGNLVWSHAGNLEEVSIIGGSKPIIHENILVVSYSSGEIYALNSVDGSLIWFDNITSGNFFNKSAVNDIQSPLTIVRDKIYVPSFSDKFIVYELFNGSEIWNLRLSSLNPIVVSGRSIYLIDTTGRLLCLDKENGKLLWAVQLKVSDNGDEITWYGPLLTSNKIILTNSNGSVISISPFTGKLMSKINFSEELVANPIQYGNQLILISKKGTLFILG
ncbi:MAG: PQQ-binding-like beta-propeller repeat protein [Alphaproteobacteria bacterium]